MQISVVYSDSSTSELQLVSIQRKSTQIFNVNKIVCKQNIHVEENQRIPVLCILNENDKNIIEILLKGMLDTSQILHV